LRTKMKIEVSAKMVSAERNSPRPSRKPVLIIFGVCCN
jgi:hypothetical protein